jgi:hypothetical protein
VAGVYWALPQERRLSHARRISVKKTKLWLRIIGIFYLLLVAMNFYFLVANLDVISDTIPFPVDENGVRAFVDAWFTFIFALAALGAVALYASTKPERAAMLVLAVVAGELSYGVGGDIWLISRGYDATSYIPFSMLHLIFAVTGIFLLRGELKERAAPVSNEVSRTVA